MKAISLNSNILIAFHLLISFCLTLPVTAQTTPDGSTPQFLYPDFSKGKVKMRNGQYQSVILNYNTVSEKMVYQKEDNLYDMVNTDMMDTVFLQNSKFVPAGKVFYEVLLAAPVSFYVQYKGKLMPPGTQAGYGGPSQVSNTKMMSSVQLSQGYYNLKLPTDYTVKVDLVYWIRKDSDMYSFMNERQFLKIFPEEATELKQYIRQNRLKFSDPADMVILAEHFNEKHK
jgi:hypothetical protein